MTIRTRRNVARCSGLGLVAVSLLLLASAGTAGADDTGAKLTAKGWWWQARTVKLPADAPTPPNVKAGQLWVQGDPNGYAAFAAVRYGIETGRVVDSLALKVGSNGDTGGSSAVLLACKTGSSWSPVDGGKWETAPTVDDKACINGQRQTDGSWTFPVKTLQTEALLDIALVPGIDPNTKKTSAFSLVFDAPTDGSLATAVGSVPTPTTATSTADLGTNTNTDTNPYANTNTQTSPAGSGGSSVPSFHPPAAITPVAPALPPDKVGVTATAPSKQAATQAPLDAQLAAAAAPSKDRNKTPGYVVLAFAAAIGLYAWRQDNLMAANGGSLPGGPAEAAGLGRFSRPRQGQPPALT